MENLIYSAITRNVIDQLFASGEHLRAGEQTAAHALLQDMESSVNKLRIITEHFRDLANQEHERCENQIEKLDLQIGDIYQHEQELEGEIRKLLAHLKGWSEKEEQTAKDIKELHKNLEVTQAKLRERMNKLEELKAWFWVPGYGQYLAVRTLVDNDISETKSLQNTLRDRQYELEHTALSIEDIKRMEANLNRTLEDNRNKKHQLEQLRGDLHERKKGLKETLIFFADVGFFWGKVKIMLQEDVEYSIKSLEQILGTLDSKRSVPSFDNLKNRGILKLKEALIRFADTIDNGKNFLLYRTDLLQA
jgi:uncharacterized phage infection (PIP) family protein YhgE